MRTLLLVAGSILPIVSTSVYIISILKGQSRPQRMTRLLLVIITFLVVISLWANGDTSGIWLAAVALTETIIIWVLSWKRGMGGTNRLDYICLSLCGAGVVLWLVSGNPVVGLIASIVADFIACLPSLHKTMRMPHTESFWFFALGSVAALFILLAGPFTWEAVAFPAYISLINLLFAVVIGTGRYRSSPAPPTPMG